MITRQQAEQLVRERINAPNPQWPDMPEMVVLHSEERELSWVVYWTSRPWHETGDIRYAIAGNGPYLVCRDDGTLFETGTVPPVEEPHSGCRGPLAGAPADTDIQMSTALNERPGVDAGWRVRFPFLRTWSRATQAGRWMLRRIASP